MMIVAKPAPQIIPQNGMAIEVMEIGCSQWPGSLLDSVISRGVSLGVSDSEPPDCSVEGSVRYVISVGACCVITAAGMPAERMKSLMIESVGSEGRVSDLPAGSV